MKLKIENFYSDYYNEEVLNEIVLDVEEVKESDLPVWLLQIKNEFEPELLQKLNAFVNGDKDKVLEYYESDEVGFEYDNDGRITRITFRGDDGSSTTPYIISYTDTECIISESDGGSVVVTIATTSNDIATINMLIWANILNEFL